MKSDTRVRQRLTFWLIALVAGLTVQLNSLAGEPETKELIHPAAAEGSFEFETSQLKGTIRLTGPYHGVSRLVDKTTGRQVIDDRYSALNLFKLMSVNLMMGQPRKMARTITHGPNWAEAKWNSTEAHLGSLVARYEVIEPNAVDLTLTVKSKGTYQAYEVFMSNYFDKSFRPYVYLLSRDRKKTDLVLPRINEVFRDTLLVFPRDSHAAQRCVDGRWNRSERGSPTIQMCPVRHYAHCLAIMADEQKSLAVVLMSRPQHCYAISTRYHADDEADRLTNYSAFDFSLFGYDMTPGDERTIKVRLAVVPLDGNKEMEQPLDLYKSFIAETNDSPVQPK